MNTLREHAGVTDDVARTKALRGVIGELRQLGALRTDRVAEAFRAVPRHVFAPEAPLEEVYAATHAIVTKRNDRGVAISSLSECIFRR